VLSLSAMLFNLILSIGHIHIVIATRGAVVVVLFSGPKKRINFQEKHRPSSINTFQSSSNKNVLENYSLSCRLEDF